VDVFGDAYGEHPGRYSNWTEDDLAFDELQKLVDVDELDKESSPEVFAEVFLRQTENGDEAMKEEYDYPRLPVDTVFGMYVYWCEEVNGIDHLEWYNGGKKAIAEALGEERKKLAYPGGEKDEMQCYTNVNYTGAGHELKEAVPDGFDYPDGS
jgi:hypothetical protein